MGRHQQYRDNLLERLRTWRLSNPDGLIDAARKHIRESINDDDVDLLCDNWVNANFDRFEITSHGPHSYSARVKSRRECKSETVEQRAEARRRGDIAANIIRSNVYEEFAARIWDTVMPNGVAWRDATGKQFIEAGGIHVLIGKLVKPNEKPYKKLTTKQIFNITQRSAIAA